MLLSINPTGAGASLDDFELPNKYGIGGVHDNLPKQKEYLSQKDVEKINQEQFENQLKELEKCEEMREIRRVKRQWERELEDDEDSFSSLSSNEDLDEGPINKFED